MPPVIHRTRAQLEDQRTRLLGEVRMDYEELRERASTYTLSMHELDVWHTIEDIDYLLEGDCCGILTTPQTATDNVT
ncbi:hypothetical protein ACL02R_08305 [Streptomyces sp. MS19]|uniref:hypothetical protein n=1 Tax=Streptomyces sp. MS19 TaxID=3385972 RepID=UPI0039A3DF6E